ncbi:MAG: hypothetical protein ER33_11835 [Cyanobium sp. CACIAM 14]|nr:MAG: hypothetical protein ER33_11835 [Cyanobium sp. CACIAM 14]
MPEGDLAGPWATAGATGATHSATAGSGRPPASGIDRYFYCRVHQDEVQAASARLANAAKPWILAAKRYSPQSEEYLAIRREYETAVADLERLLPPQIRNGMDLLPTAAKAFSRCDREELETAAGAPAA